MFSNLSTRAGMVLLQARREAGKRGANSLDVNSLVVGLIIEDQDPISMEAEELHLPKRDVEPRAKPPLLSLKPGRAVPRYAFFSPELAAGLLAKLNDALPKSNGIEDTTPMSATPEFQRVFHTADELRRKFHRSKVEPLELLAAALRESCEATRFLIDAGITEENMLRILRSAGDSTTLRE